MSNLDLQHVGIFFLFLFCLYFKHCHVLHTQYSCGNCKTVIASRLLSLSQYKLTFSHSTRYCTFPAGVGFGGCGCVGDCDGADGGGGGDGCHWC